MQALSHDHSLYDVSHVPSQKECHHCAPSNGVLDELGGGSHDHSGQCSNDQNRDSWFLHCHGRDPGDHVLRISFKCHVHYQDEINIQDRKVHYNFCSHPRRYDAHQGKQGSIPPTHYEEVLFHLSSSYPSSG